MGTTVVLEKEHAYPAAVFIAYVLAVQFYMAGKVMGARKKYGVKYPTLYADKRDVKEAHEFNCIQRAHQNNVENAPNFYGLLLIASLQNPKVAGIAGVVYFLGRLAYFSGYASGVPSKRNVGAFSYLGLFTLLGQSGYFVYNLLT
mmetsp:Transcript_6690/g.17011  ORF Transcript_6690/g.17011 Transcript_6690/m.17011 type:complete len:145 (+) Transcript_6690:669-1103(+)